jgi:Glycosyl transferase family 2
MKLIMTLLVRNAEKLLRENLEFHIQQGVDFFIITDNRSVDGTSRIIEEYVAAGLAERIWEPEDTYSQGRWVTRMAKHAATTHRADWVINSDDDEFWSASAGTLRDVLGGLPCECLAVEVARRNHPPIAGPPSEHFLSSMVYRERHSLNVFGDPLPPKIIHRAFANIEIAQGNHKVSRAGVELAARPIDAIAISHFPIRDFPSFERKIMHGGAAYERNTELAPEVGNTWRWLYALWRQGELKAWYDRQLLQPDQIAVGLASGALIRDESVLRAVGPRRED